MGRACHYYTNSVRENGKMKVVDITTQIVWAKMARSKCFSQRHYYTNSVGEHGKVRAVDITAVTVWGEMARLK